jgi:hypothetical protein
MLRNPVARLLLRSADAALSLNCSEQRCLRMGVVQAIQDRMELPNENAFDQPRRNSTGLPSRISNCALPFGKLET